uniref:Succinate dehydrogenase hydrophobic subunit n=1 Tax=Cavernulicola chilensis TaxID=3028028 RepID=A0A7H0WB96_9RHOD|nr:succinate dehydrogenase hydrophobic subunit [Cavernulicola chilensis]QNR39825.1 succinate dehydrogenase hydrophobic subunit [Cavernulicola chilensis]
MNLLKHNLAYLHWWSQRLTAIIIIPWLFGLNINAIVLLSPLLVLHFRMGLETIFEDYVHQNNTKILGFLLIRAFTLYALYDIFEFLI